MNFPLCILCGPLCLCGEGFFGSPYHRGTEVSQSTTEILGNKFVRLRVISWIDLVGAKPN